MRSFTTRILFPVLLVATLANAEEASAPPPVTGLKATHVSKDGKSFIHMTWDAKRPADKVTQYFRIHADDLKPGEVLLQASISPVKGNSYDYEVLNDDDRDWTVGVWGVGPAGETGKLSTVTCFVPGRTTPRVERVALASTADDSPTVTVSWEYTSRATTAGFRVYNEKHELLADEKTLDGVARSWKHEKLKKNVVYSYIVHAVSKTGVESQGSPQQTVTAGVVVARPREPRQLRAERVAVEGKTVIRLKWDAPQGVAPAQYIVSIDKNAFGDFTDPKDSPTTAQPEFEFTAASDRTYTFRVYSVGSTGLKSAGARVVSLQPGRDVAPAILLDGPDRDLSASKLTYHWQYDATPNLKGFRFYIDGKVAADESQLGPGVRKFQTPALAPGEHTYELEAVSTQGTVSERGAAIKMRWPA